MLLKAHLGFCVKKRQERDEKWRQGVSSEAPAESKQEMTETVDGEKGTVQDTYWRETRDLMD